VEQSFGSSSVKNNAVKTVVQERLQFNDVRTHRNFSENLVLFIETSLQDGL